MTYDSRSILIDGRRARVFGAAGADLDAGEALLRRTAVDAEERARLPLLETALAGPPVVEAIAHPAEDRRDEMHVFVVQGGKKIFACVVMLASHVELDLETQPFVLEDLSHQVMDEDRLDSAALGAAMRAWASRNFSSVAPREWDIRPWGASLAGLVALGQRPRDERPVEGAKPVVVPNPAVTRVAA